MAEDFSGPSKPKAVWEPGTLDATRKNIGAIDKEEAERMTKVLGGEIMTEKSVPIDYSKLPKRAPSHRVVRPTNVSAALKEANNGARLLLQVHDELILECPDKSEIVEQTIALLRQKMEGAVKLSIPLRVSIEHGANWGEFH